MKCRPVITALVCAAVVSTVFAGSLLDRDAQRLIQARQNHLNEIDKAREVYTNAVSRANERLTRIYDRTIEQYESRGDSATAQRLRQELLAITQPSESDQPEDEGYTSEPFTDLIEAIGPVMLGAGGLAAPTNRLARYEYIALYYTASWCGPCVRFSDQFKEFYSEHRSPRWEVVVVTRERNEPAFLRYMQSADLPWAVVPFHRMDYVGDAYRSGMPRVIVLNRDGEMVTDTRLGMDGGTERFFNEMLALLSQ